MITYMTCMSFFDTAADFDLQSAAQMHLESRAILHDLLYDDEPLLNPKHPVLRMWSGHEVALGVYAEVMAVRMTQFGINKQLDSTVVRDVESILKDGSEFEVPWWMQDKLVLSSHRSNITRRWPDRYPQGTWPEPSSPRCWPYLWPIDGKLLVSKDDKQRLADGERFLPLHVQEKVENL